MLDLIKNASPVKVYPVGRLDRNTSGVLLLTNDGDLTQKLTHPSHETKKVYAVTLDKPLAKAHFDEILNGVPLEDGAAHVDVLAYTDNADKTQIGVEIHSGRNRIVRRMMAAVGSETRFEQGREQLELLAGLEVTAKSVERQAEAIGAAIEAGEQKEIRLAYRVKWPSDRDVIYGDVR